MVGCAEEKKKPSNANTPAVVVDPGSCNPATEDCSDFVNDCITNPGSTNCTVADDFGGDVPLTNVSLSSFRKLAKNNALTSVPTDLRLKMSLSKYGNGFAGDVAITFTYAGIPYTYAATSAIQNPYSDAKIQEDAQYNVQFTNKKFHGFFDSFIRSIIVVVDDLSPSSEGDGAPVRAKGAIYIRNHPNNPEYCANPYPGMSYNDWVYSCAPHPPKPCWFVYAGPYDCRTWKSGNGVNTYQSLYPQSEYTKIGDFENLNLETAFNGDFSL